MDGVRAIGAGLVAVLVSGGAIGTHIRAGASPLCVRARHYGSKTATDGGVAGAAELVRSKPPTDVSERLIGLVYELLDAHHDTARLAADQTRDQRWDVHLDYLRDLQRVGRETLAYCASAEPHASRDSGLRDIWRKIYCQLSLQTSTASMPSKNSSPWEDPCSTRSSESSAAPGT